MTGNEKEEKTRKPVITFIALSTYLGEQASIWYSYKALTFHPAEDPSQGWLEEWSLPEDSSGPQRFASCSS